MLKFNGRVIVGSGRNIRRKSITTLHDSQLGGHSSIQASFMRAKQMFYWPRMYKEIKAAVLECDVCKKCKDEHVAYRVMLLWISLRGYLILKGRTPSW